MLQTPTGRLDLGDADGYLTVSVDPGRTRVVVSVEDPTDKSPDHVWIDLLAAVDG
jgi:hypothetical protein